MSASCRNCTAEIPDGETLCAQCTPPTPSASDRSSGDRSSGGEAPPILPPRYEIIRLLGRGGMGRVFLCRDTDLDVEVAIKVLPPDVAADEDALEEIRSEARVSAKLRDCPGIIVLYGFETHGETSFLVMEYAPNGSLRQRLKEGEIFPESECRKIGLEILRGLVYAHRRKVLHRDIKPANVLFDQVGRARLADFGLAKLLADASTRKSLRAVAGTPSYIPPEVIRQMPADARADLYSLGCMLFEMATGSPPFEGTIGEVISAKLAAGEAGTPDPRDKQPELSEGFAAVVRQLMAVEPEDRYPDAETAFVALRGRRTAAQMAATGEDESGPISGPRPEPKRRRTRVVAALVVVLLVAGLLLAIAVTGGDGGDEEPGPAADGTVASETTGPAAEPGQPDDAGSPEARPAEDPRPSVVEGIHVRTDPPGAMVSVDGVERGSSGTEGLLLADLPPGVSVVISVAHPDCEAGEERPVVWNRGEREELRVSLVRKSGALLFRNGVPGAAVTVKREGAAPLFWPLNQDGTLGPVPLEFGSYDVAVKKPGYEPLKLSVRIEVGVEQTVDASLVEKDGRLTIDSVPSGARVYAGDTLIGETPLRGVTIGPGRYRLRLDHPGRDLLILPQEVEVRGESDVDLGTLVLPALAILDLRSLPDGVTASIGGKPVSETVALRSGAVEMLLEKERHRPQAIELMLESGKATMPPIAAWEPLPGRIDVGEQPEGVDILLDGRLIADHTAPVPAPVGPHRVDLYRPSHRPVRLTVEVEPDTTAVLPGVKWSRKWYAPIVKRLAPPPEPDLTKTTLPPGVRLNERRIYWEKDDAEMAIVPAGEFAMGSDNQGENPVHRVAVSAFLMDRHEVMNEQFARFVKETSYLTQDEMRGQFRTWRLRVRTDDRLPVIYVTHADAKAYAKWAGKRLPTEAEFEWALRGGHAGKTYPWGDGPPTGGRTGNFADRSFDRKGVNREFLRDYDDKHEVSAPVASFEPNAYGLFDLSGNVWEWVGDWFAPYPDGPLRDPVGPKEGTLRILRGGSYASAAAGLRSASRRAQKPEFSSTAAGFRCVVDLPR